MRKRKGMRHNANRAENSYKESNRKKRTAGISALLLAVLLLLGGTFAWYTFASELNEFEHEPYGALLHDDYKETRGDDRVSNKDVYVENTGEVDLSVRVQLKEYMEIEGTSLIAGKTKEDRESWSVHKYDSNAGKPAVEDCEAVFHDYWSWKLGGEAVEYEKGKMFQSGTKYRYDEEGNDTLQTAVNTGYTNGGRSSGVITIEEYMADYFYQDIPFGGWILDSADGYAYWSDYLEPGETTGLLLDEVVLKDEINHHYYYGIEVVMEAVDDADMLSWLEPNMLTTDGRETAEASEGAKEFLHQRYYGALESIEVEEEPDKMDYEYGDELEPEGLVLTLTYETGRTKKVAYSDKSGIAWEPDAELGTPYTASEQESIPVKISYEGKDTTLNVKVDNPIETVTISGTPKKTEYEHGQEFVPDGLKVTAVRKSGYVELDEADADTGGLEWELLTFENDTTNKLTNQSAEVRVTYKGETDSITITGLTITNPLSKIEIENGPVNDQIWGELFDPEGLELKRTYKSGVEDYLLYSASAGITWDIETTLGTAGLNVDEEEQDLIIYYGGKETPLNIIVYNPVHEVIISEDVNEKEYEHDEELDPEGLKVTAIRKSGTVEMNEAEADTEGLDWNLPTLQNNTVETQMNQSVDVSVTYKEITGSETITGLTITNPLKAIGISQEAKKDYEWGQPFDPTNLVIERIYKSDISDTLAYTAGSGISWSSGTTELGTPNLAVEQESIVITISYGVFDTTQTVTINNPITEVSIGGTPVTNYETGIEFSKSGLTVTAKRKSGYPELTDAPSDTAGLDWTMPVMTNTTTTPITNGIAEVVVKYKDVPGSKTFTGITITNPLQSIAITTKPKTDYEWGAPFDPTGMIITCEYKAGIPVEVPYSASSGITCLPEPNSVLELSSTSLATGTVTIVVRYGEKPANLIVTVNNPVDTVTISGSLNTTSYVTGTKLSNAGLSVTAKRKSGYSFTPAANEITWNLPTLTNTGQSALTNQSASVTATYDKVPSEVRTFTGITITNPLKSITATQPTKKIYYEGEEFESAGMTVTGLYTSGNSYTLTSGWSCTPETLTTVGTQTITVSYTGVSPATTTVTVKSWKDAINDKSVFDDVIIKDNIWIILSKNTSTGQAELLSKDCVMKMAYNSSESGWKWSTSEIRMYLKGTYYNSLPADLRNNIVTMTKDTNLPGTDLATTGDRQTNETVYLLSHSEYDTYNTAFKAAKGTSLGTYGVSTTYSYWWLRSPNGIYTHTARHVGRSAGNVSNDSVTYLNGVRPTLTVTYK